jgi:hypothetical protein
VRTLHRNNRATERREKIQHILSKVVGREDIVDEQRSLLREQLARLASHCPIMSWGALYEADSPKAKNLILCDRKWSRKRLIYRYPTIYVRIRKGTAEQK